jgi:hypothetical protein
MAELGGDTFAESVEYYALSKFLGKEEEALGTLKNILPNPFYAWLQKSKKKINDLINN